MRKYNDVQITTEELKLITRVLRCKPGCKFLVFGLGNDSHFWNRFNQEGTTVFLEDDKGWFSKVMKKHPNLTAFLVNYGSQLSQAEALLNSPAVFDLGLPAEVKNTSWDVILVDAPLGEGPSAPGRMKSIAAASRLVRNSGDVFVHDCDRIVERNYTDKFLGQKNLVAEIGKLRHFNMREGCPDQFKPSLRTTAEFKHQAPSTKLASSREIPITKLQINEC